MPPAVTYWTGTWAPGMEAHTDFIQELRRRRDGADRVMSISSGQSGRLLPRRRVWRFGQAQWWYMRTVAPVIERLGRVNHVFGSSVTWHLLRAIGCRPTVFTVTIDEGPVHADVRHDVSKFVAESDELAISLAAQGIEAEVIHPGVDLARFTPAPPPDGTFRVLFASSPAHPGEFDARGIPLLVELARACPDIEVRCLWRPWDDESEAVAALGRLDAPRNLVIARGKAPDMAREVANAHAVVIAYEKGFGKAAPQSILEGLATGRPALLGPHCSIAPVIAEAGAGAVATEQSGAALAEALSALRSDYESRAAAARALAEKRFSFRSAAARYEAIYAELASA